MVYEKTEIVTPRGTISFAPGAGPITIESTAEQAIENMRVFLEDSRREKSAPTGMRWWRLKSEDEDGRFGFRVKVKGAPYAVNVQMPGIALDKVRYMREEGQNIWDFPRLYVSGSSWIWMFGMLSKADFYGDEEDGE